MQSLRGPGTKLESKLHVDFNDTALVSDVNK